MKSRRQLKQKWFIRSRRLLASLTPLTLGIGGIAGLLGYSIPANEIVAMLSLMNEHLPMIIEYGSLISSGLLSLWSMLRPDDSQRKVSAKLTLLPTPLRKHEAKAG